MTYWCQDWCPSVDEGGSTICRACKCTISRLAGANSSFFHHMVINLLRLAQDLNIGLLRMLQTIIAMRLAFPIGLTQPLKLLQSFPILLRLRTQSVNLVFSVKPGCQLVVYIKPALPPVPTCPHLLSQVTRRCICRGGHMQVLILCVQSMHHALVAHLIYHMISPMQLAGVSSLREMGMVFVTFL